MKRTMKVILTMAAALLLSVNTYAQTEQGHWLVGASSNLGFSSGKVDKDQDDATTNFNITPTIGYFLIDNLAAGIALDFNSSKTGDYKSSTFGLGPFVRYYLPMKVFGQLSYAFGSSTSNDGSGSGDVKANTGDLGIAVGYAWMLNDNISLEPSIRYDLTSYKPDGADESIKGSTFGINVGFTLYFGGN
ncbi:hypothetical protein BH11BAC2_BH11BAC2_01600 [soil metagenome]